MCEKTQSCVRARRVGAPERKVGLTQRRVDHGTVGEADTDARAPAKRVEELARPKGQGRAVGVVHVGDLPGHGRRADDVVLLAPIRHGPVEAAQRHRARLRDEGYEDVGDELRRVLGLEACEQRRLATRQARTVDEEEVVGHCLFACFPRKLHDDESDRHITSLKTVRSSKMRPTMHCRCGV